VHHRLYMQHSGRAQTSRGATAVRSDRDWAFTAQVAGGALSSASPASPASPAPGPGLPARDAGGGDPARAPPAPPPPLPSGALGPKRCERRSLAAPSWLLSGVLAGGPKPLLAPLPNTGVAASAARRAASQSTAAPASPSPSACA
jgi:hypothetical protein